MTNITNIWDSPVTGAYLLWEFIQGFCDIDPSGPNLLLAFPVLAILSTPELSAPLSSESIESLSDYTFSFIERGDPSLDMLQSCIDDKRETIRVSLSLGFVSCLFTVTKGGKLRVNPGPPPNGAASAFRKEAGKIASRLGKILAKSTPEIIGFHLGVNF